MVTSLPSGLILFLLLGGLGGVAEDPPQPADEGHVRVEIRGRLLRDSAEDRPADAPASYRIEAAGINFPLEFRDGPREPGAPGRLVGRIVVVRGALVRRDGSQQLTCIVEGDVNEARATEYLVGYQDDRAEEISALVKELGLTLRSRYEPGKYMIVVEPVGVDPMAIGRLKKAPGVRYVELNQGYRIPERR